MRYSPISKTLNLQRVLLRRLARTLRAFTQPKGSRTKSSESHPAAIVPAQSSLSDAGLDAAPATGESARAPHVAHPRGEDLAAGAPITASTLPTHIARPTVDLELAARSSYPQPQAPDVMLPFEIICDILLSHAFSLSELLPMRQVSRSWRDAVYAHPVYYRDIFYWPGEAEREERDSNDSDSESEDSSISIPFEFLKARLECSSRPVRLYLSTIGNRTSEFADEIFLLVAKHMHRFYELKLAVDVESALAPVLLALGKPAPLLQLFHIMGRKWVVVERRSHYYAPADDDDGDDGGSRLVGGTSAAVDTTTPAEEEENADRAHAHAANDDAGGEGNASSSTTAKVEYCVARALTPLTPDLFAGCAPRLVSLELHDVSLTASTPYPAFTNVRTLTSSFCFDRSHGVSSGRILSLFPVLESADLDHHDYCGVSGAWDLPLDEAAPVRQLRHLGLRSGDPHEDVFTTVALPEIPSLTITIPSEHTMRRMFSDLEDQLQFSVSCDAVTGNFSWTISEFHGQRRRRTVEITASEWWAWGSGRFLTACMDARIRESITRIRLRASHIRYMAGIGAYWPSVGVVQIDITDKSDIDAVLKGRFVPVIRSGFPALYLLLLYWPNGPDDPTPLQTWANWATVRFFGRDATQEYLIQTAYVTDPALADAVFRNPEEAWEHPDCHLWSNIIDPWGEYGLVVEHVKKLLKWKDDTSRTREQRQADDMYLNMYINMPDY
ncbi:hypothetical protein EXIGLDRAFT_747423 [Exidia glandulosa HHB12029]|uniref:Uncharacterized protein n=1 Tax=Exidia glandulosa HHB12029 TaxID=1314781 RepID=A0A165KU90_EXIGL|nr:hypothetical protein EXIGLDRAFT_747423 [Exidia glandulosa HHB12029]